MMSKNKGNGKGKMEDHLLFDVNNMKEGQPIMGEVLNFCRFDRMPTYIKKATDLTPLEKLVCMVMAQEEAFRGGPTYLSANEVANNLGIKYESARRCLNSLVKKKYIIKYLATTKEIKKGIPNKYRFLFKNSMLDYLQNAFQEQPAKPEVTVVSGTPPNRMWDPPPNRMWEPPRTECGNSIDPYRLKKEREEEEEASMEPGTRAREGDPGPKPDSASASLSDEALFLTDLFIEERERAIPGLVIREKTKKNLPGTNEEGLGRHLQKQRRTKKEGLRSRHIL